MSSWLLRLTPSPEGDGIPLKLKEISAHNSFRKSMQNFQMKKDVSTFFTSNRFFSPLVPVFITDVPRSSSSISTWSLILYPLFFSCSKSKNTIKLVRYQPNVDKKLQGFRFYLISSQQFKELMLNITLLKSTIYLF